MVLGGKEVTQTAVLFGADAGVGLVVEVEATGRSEALVV